MLTTPRLLTFLAVVLLGGCGASRTIGNEAACDAAQPCPGTEVCDVGAVCRDLCGPNAPGTTCSPGTTCVDYVCRPTCSVGAGCPSGLTCAQGICAPPPCSATTACPMRQACVSGACQSIGTLCTAAQCSGASEVCDQGVCRVQCGPNYPNNFCATGESCQNSLCR